MANITPTTPSFVFGYWRPWKEDSNYFNSYCDYVKDVTLAKYSADTVGNYINQASKEQISAINEVGEKIGQGMSVLSGQMDNIALQLDESNQQLSFINQNLNLQIEQQLITNLLLENISSLLRVPESEKKRQHHIELGLKFLANSSKDEDLITDALEELLAAEELMKQDYFVLHRIGMIYLFAKKFIDPQKAIEYFKKAGKYASVESDPTAAKLVNALTLNQKVENAKIYTDSNGPSLLAAESYEKAAFAAYVLGNFQEAVSFGEKAKQYLPNAQNMFMLAKYKIRNCQIDEAVTYLSEAIDIMPELISACFSELDLINETKVLKLLDEKNETQLLKIKEMIEFFKTSLILKLDNNYIYKDNSIHILSDTVNNYIQNLTDSLLLNYTERQKIYDFINKVLVDSKILKVGCKSSGGIVFYIDESGKHGLIAAEQDQGENQWGTYVIVGTNTSIGSGYNNTNLIIDKASWYKEKGLFSKGIKSLHTAAVICKDLKINGYNDWYLPSKDELNLLYLQKKIIGNFTSTEYWSSSECGESYAWRHDFNYGYQTNCYKDNEHKVRAIRAF